MRNFREIDASLYQSDLLTFQSGTESGTDWRTLTCGVSEDRNMPAKFEMTWDSRNRRWRKMHNGQRYVVSCQELGTLETKEGSYQQANRWWAAKKAEVEGQKPQKPKSIHEVMLPKFRDWASRHGLTE